MVVLGDGEWLASAVAEHERVEGGEQQKGGVSSVGNRSTSLGGPAASSARSTCVMGSEDHSRGLLRRRAVGCAVASAKDRECLVGVDRRGRIGRLQ